MIVNTEEICNDVFKKIEEITVSEIPVSYIEENLVDEYKNDFQIHIRDKGLEYYEEGNVLRVCKNKNRYIAFVQGRDIEPYQVMLDVHDHHIDYECSCPCNYNCKHEYATLLAISDKEYDEVELKKEIQAKKIDLKDLLQNISAEEIKTYLVNNFDMVRFIFDDDSFFRTFRKYLPKEKYEFYYNSLYNELVLCDGYTDKAYCYLDLAKEFLASDEFREVFKLMKSIVNAYHDANYIDSDDFINMVSEIGMYLRITYRKGDETTAQMIHNWVLELEKVNYFNSYYLEDIILSIR